MYVPALCDVQGHLSVVHKLAFKSNTAVYVPALCDVQGHLHQVQGHLSVMLWRCACEHYSPTLLCMCQHCVMDRGTSV